MPVPHGPSPEPAGPAAALKARRERLWLSLADGAGWSGLTRAAISRPENGWNTNPTLETVYRFAPAPAPGANVRPAVEDATPGDAEP